jgi:hypothetical protein
MGVTLSLPAGQTIAEGHERELARLLFQVDPAATLGGTSAIGFADSPTSRGTFTTNNVPLTALFVAGLVRLESVSNRVSVERLANGSYRLTLEGLAYRNYAIDVSTDLSAWAEWRVVHADLEGSVRFDDSETAGVAQRFYRARLVP